MTRNRASAANAKAVLGKCTEVWIATLNVGSLGAAKNGESGLAAAIRIAEGSGVNILFVQEARLSAMNVGAFKTTARKMGWKLIEGMFDKSKDGVANGGVASCLSGPLLKSRCQK